MRTSKRRRLKKRLLIIVLLLTLLLGLFAYQYRPLMLDTALKVARNTANEAVNDTVYQMLSEGQWMYEDLITVTYNDSGDISSLQANASRINAVKSQTALLVYDTLSNESVHRISVPLGTLCASTLLSGRGPDIPCRVLMSAVPQVSLQYHFDGAGINQTLHSIIMTVTVPLSVTLPMQGGDTEIKTSFLIGETILVGQIPDAYTNVISDPEVADDIFNYGDVG